jgi:polyhydroxyalkanoate synthesis regulator phasin
MQASIKQTLAGLVSNGTITQDQSDKVVQAYAQAFAKRSQGSGQHGSYQQGSGQQGSGQQMSGQRQNPIMAPLVSNGTITQDQANAINQAISKAMPHHGPRTGGSGQQNSGGSGSGQTTTE